MADLRAQATENAIGANHPTLTDTINRLTLASHNNDGTHRADLRFDTPKINENVTVTATATELNYVDGVTSAIQTQINTKAPIAAPTFTGNADFSGTGAVKVPVGTIAERPSPTQGMFRYNTTSGSYEGYNGLIWGAVGGGGGISIESRTSTFTVEDRFLYLCNTSSGAFNANLIAGVEKKYVEFWDFDGTWRTNPLTIIPNGTDKIGGINTSLICNVNNTRLALTYCDTTQGWQIDIGGEAHAGAGFNPTVQQFSGNGSNPTFTLSANPGSALALIVAISGVSQVPNVDYTVSGTTLTFTTAPPSGTNNIMVHAFGAQGTIGTPANGVVIPTALSTGGPTWTAGGALSVTTSTTVGSAAADPSGANGMLYYDTAGNRLRAYVNGVWKTVTVA